MCSGIRHVGRWGAGLKRAKKSQLSPHRSRARPPYLSLGLYLLCVHSSLAGTTAQPSTHSTDCLALACPSSLAPLISLVLAQNTTCPLQMTPNHETITWSDYLLGHCWQIFSPSPTQPAQRIPLVSMPSWIRQGFSKLFQCCCSDGWPLTQESALQLL